MGIIIRIRNLICKIARCKAESAQPVKTVAAPAPKSTQVTPAIHADMHPTLEVAMVGGIAYQVYHERGSRKLAHIRIGNLYVPLSVFTAPRKVKR